MPRTGKGGKVDGAVGQAYSNRTDLNAATKTVPNQEYGKAAAQRMAMANLPMASAPTMPTMQAPQGAPAQRPPEYMAPAGPTTPGPGQLPFLHPTNRPDEPLTAGLPTGAGPGPEAIMDPAQQRMAYLSSTLKDLASSPGATPETIRMATLLGALGS